MSRRVCGVSLGAFCVVQPDSILSSAQHTEPAFLGEAAGVSKRLGRDFSLPCSHVAIADEESRQLHPLPSCVSGHVHTVLKNTMKLRVCILLCASQTTRRTSCLLALMGAVDLVHPGSIWLSGFSLKDEPIATRSVIVD